MWHPHVTGSWNFWEASHGKGAPDGIGGAMKRKADKLISLGHDIPDIAHLYRALMQEETSMKLFYVVEADDVEEAAVPENVTSRTWNHEATPSRHTGSSLHQVSRCELLLQQPWNIKLHMLRCQSIYRPYQSAANCHWPTGSSCIACCWRTTCHTSTTDKYCEACLS